MELDGQLPDNLEHEITGDEILLKGGLDSIKGALSSVSVRTTGLKTAQRKATSIEVKVESDSTSAIHNVHLLFHPDNNQIIPAFKIGSASTIDDLDQGHDPFSTPSSFGFRAATSYTAEYANYHEGSSSGSTSVQHSFLNQSLLISETVSLKETQTTAKTEEEKKEVIVETEEPSAEDVEEIAIPISTPAPSPGPAPPVNNAPVGATFGTAYADVGSAFYYIYNTYFNEPDGQDMTFTVELSGGGALPGWLTQNVNNNWVQGTPAGGDIGNFDVAVTASDGSATATEIFTLYVDNYDFYGTSGDDNITGSAGADHIVSNQGADTIDGAGGNDTIYSGDGDDSVDGGANHDLIYGGGGEDTLNGGTGADTLYGGDGNDTLNGGDGQNVLYGGAGNDSLIATATNQTMYGGDGDDVLDNSGGVGGQLFGGDGNDSIYGGISQQTITGGAGDDLITSQNQFDDLRGGDGNDTIRAGGHNDTVYGDDGDDKLEGGANNDTLYGGNGNDTLTGDTGNDSFIFDNLNGNDHITDFRVDVLDTIRLSDAAFIFASGEGAKNNVALTDDTDIFDVASDFILGSFTSGGGATFLYDTTDGQLWYDADGDGGSSSAILILTIDNFVTYTYNAGDFIGFV